MISQLIRLAVTIIITVLLLQACVGCTVSKHKSVQRTTKDSVSVDSVISIGAKTMYDTTTGIGKKEVKQSSEETYTKTTIDSPVVVHVRDTAYIDRVITVKEQGKKVIQIEYRDTFANERRKYMEEITALKRHNSEAVKTTTEVKTKEKETNWPWWIFVMCGLSLGCFMYVYWSVTRQGVAIKKAT